MQRIFHTEHNVSEYRVPNSALFPAGPARCPHAGCQAFVRQKFDALRHCFKEAVMMRDVPKLVYTDNGKIYRSQQFEYICASIGCTLLHSQPFDPQGLGKIGRFFGTVRMRLLSRLDVENIRDLDTLNERYFKCLEEYYTKKEHSALNGKSPLRSLGSLTPLFKTVLGKKSSACGAYAEWIPDGNRIISGCTFVKGLTRVLFLTQKNPCKLMIARISKIAILFQTVKEAILIVPISIIINVNLFKKPYYCL